MKIINKNEINFNAHSWFDDYGRVFTFQEKLFRGIYARNVDIVKTIINSGLIEKLVEKDLFPETKITEYVSEDFPLILEHRQIETINYPFEWSFSMLKDAAITILEVNKVANEFGYQLKDCHGYNILFDKLKPKFIDFGSFIKYDKYNGDWYALDEFIRFYYYPLKLWSHGFNFFSRNSLICNFGFLPHSSYILNKYKIARFFKASLIDKLFQIYYVYRRFYSLNIDSYHGKIRPKKLAIVNKLHSRRLLPVPRTSMNRLKSRILKIKSPSSATQWGNYHSNKFSNIKVDHRFSRIIEILNEFQSIKSAIDIAANQGYFSHLILENTSIKKVISTDYDEVAVDAMYNYFKNSEKKPHSLILQNFIVPVSTSKTESSGSRFKCDVAIALALTHHLFLTQHIPPSYFFNIINNHTNKYVMIEFMPLGLSSGNNNPLIPDWYTIDWFKEEFSKFFKILIEEKLEQNRILFVGEKVL